MMLQAESDNDDDDITVTINQDEISKSMENEKLKSILNDSCYEIDGIAVTKELQNLVEDSMYKPVTKSVTVLYQNKILLIPYKKKISDILASIFWDVPKLYKKQALNPFFNKNLQEYKKNDLVITEYPDGTPITETVAFIAGKYVKHNSNRSFQNSVSTLQKWKMNFKRCDSGLYHYNDFTAVIMNNGDVIDFAIHGHTSNIMTMFEIHNPKKVYYNAFQGDAFDVLLHYGRPFNIDHKQLFPVEILQHHIPMPPFNNLPQCVRNDDYCSFCIALRDVRKLLLGDSFETQRQRKSIDRNVDFSKRRCIKRPRTNELGHPVYNSKMYTPFKPKKSCDRHASSKRRKYYNH